MNWPLHFFSQLGTLLFAWNVVDDVVDLGIMLVVCAGEVVEKQQDHEWQVLVIVVSDTGF